MKRSRVDNIVYEYMANIIENSGAKPKDKIKFALLSNKYYSDIKEALDLSKTPAKTRKIIMAEFMLFMIRFESICAKAFRPLTGSMSVSEEIMLLQNKKIKSDLLGDNNLIASNELKKIQ